MRRSQFVLLLAAPLLLVPGSRCGPTVLPPSSYFGEWPTRGGNFERSGAINPNLTLPLEEAWRSRAGKGIQSSAVPIGSLVIVSTTDGKIRALSSEDGKKIWETKIKGSFLASPVVSGGKMYISSEYPDGTLYCLDVKHGKILWKYEIGASRSTSTIEGGVVYTVNNEGELFAHNGATGDLLWKNNTDSFPSQSPVVRGDSLFVSSGLERLIVLSTVDGTVLTEITLPASPYPSLTMIDNRLYYGSDSGVGVISPSRSHESSWWFEVSRAYKLAVSEEVILVSDGVRKITALEIESGEVRWSRTTAGLIEAAPLILDNMGIIVTLSGEIKIFEIDDGKLMWDTRIEVSLPSPPIVTGNYLLVTTERGELIAFSSPDDTTEPATG